MPSSHAALVIALVLALAALAGFAWTTHRDTSSASAMPSSPVVARVDERALSDDAVSELTAELRGVRFELSQLRDDLRLLHEAPSTRTPVEGADLSELASLIERLEAVATKQARSTRTTLPRPLPDTTPRTSELAQLASLRDQANQEERSDEFTRQFLLWTMEDVLDRMGVPDDIDVRQNGMPYWTYRGPGDEGFRLTVLFHAGRVVNVW